HRPRALRRRRRGQHHDRPDYAALRPAAVHHLRDLRRAAARHHPRHDAVRLGDARCPRDHHLRSGHRALAPAIDGLQRLKSMTKPIYVFNGPNLNRLGKREPEIYGTTTLAEIEAMCRAAAQRHPIEFRQSNSEAEIIDWIHEAIDRGVGIIINPAGLSFRSIPVLDALKMFPGPIFELHISNIHRREEIYQHSLMSRAATAVLMGLGADGYPTAVAAMLRLLAK